MVTRDDWYDDDRVHQFPGSKERERAPVEELPLLFFNEILPSLDALDFVQGVLVEKSAIVIYGESNAGKTFWATDLALHVAAGLPWNGRRVEGGGVVYVALEGGIGFRNRVAAWRDARGLSGQNIPFAAIPSSINLLDPNADTGRLIDAVKKAAEAFGAPVKLIVIDTLARAMAGGNENASEDMGLLVMNQDRIREETGAAVIWIHHSGKDAAKGARGHSSLRAAVDTEIEVIADPESDAKSATIAKQRELKKGDVFGFTLEVVKLGDNRHGESVETCVVQHDSGSSVPTRDAKMRVIGHAKSALEILDRIISASGRTDMSKGVPTGAMTIPDEWWRERFYESAMPGAERKTKEKAFLRASSSLVENRLVGMAANRIWIIKNTKKDD